MGLTVKETSEKTYKVGKIGDWTVNLNYESINGASPKQINIDATKELSPTTFFNMTYANNAGSNFNFNPVSATDLSLIETLLTEINTINDSFSS